MTKSRDREGAFQLNAPSRSRLFGNGLLSQIQHQFHSIAVANLPLAHFSCPASRHSPECNETPICKSPCWAKYLDDLPPPISLSPPALPLSNHRRRQPLSFVESLTM